MWEEKRTLRGNPSDLTRHTLSDLSKAWNVTIAQSVSKLLSSALPLFGCQNMFQSYNIINTGICFQWNEKITRENGETGKMQKKFVLRELKKTKNSQL